MQGRKTTSFWQRSGVQALAIVGVLLALWQLAVSLFSPPHYILPAPIDVLNAFLHQPGYFATHSAITLEETLLGLLFGSLFGILSALLVVSLPLIGWFFWPLLVVSQAFPVFVLAPLLVTWFGFGLAPKIIMATLTIFFPVASAFADGLRRTEADYIDAAALSGASKWQILRRVRIPLALPALVSGLRVAAPFAPTGALIGEWVGASGGLGFIMTQANNRMQSEVVFVAVALIGVMTLGSRALVNRLAPRLTPWAQVS